MNRIIRSLFALLFALSVTAGAAVAQGPDPGENEASEQGTANQEVIADCIDDRPADPEGSEHGIGECVRNAKPNPPGLEATVEGEHGRSGDHPAPGGPEATGQGQPDATGRPDSPGQSEATPPGPRR